MMQNNIELNLEWLFAAFENIKITVEEIKANQDNEQLLRKNAKILKDKAIDFMTAATTFNIMVNGNKDRISFAKGEYR